MLLTKLHLSAADVDADVHRHCADLASRATPVARELGLVSEQAAAVRTGARGASSRRLVPSRRARRRRSAACATCSRSASVLRRLRTRCSRPTASRPSCAPPRPPLRAATRRRPPAASRSSAVRSRRSTRSSGGGSSPTRRRAPRRYASSSSSASGPSSCRPCESTTARQCSASRLTLAASARPVRCATPTCSARKGHSLSNGMRHGARRPRATRLRRCGAASSRSCPPSALL